MRLPVKDSSTSCLLCVTTSRGQGQGHPNTREKKHIKHCLSHYVSTGSSRSLFPVGCIVFMIEILVYIRNVLYAMMYDYHFGVMWRLTMCTYFINSSILFQLISKFAHKLLNWTNTIDLAKIIVHKITKHMFPWQRNTPL